MRKKSLFCCETKSRHEKQKGCDEVFNIRALESDNDKLVRQRNDRLARADCVKPRIS